MGSWGGCRLITAALDLHDTQNDALEAQAQEAEGVQSSVVRAWKAVMASFAYTYMTQKNLSGAPNKDCLMSSGGSPTNGIGTMRNDLVLLVPAKIPQERIIPDKSCYLL